MIKFVLIISLILATLPFDYHMGVILLDDDNFDQALKDYPYLMVDFNIIDSEGCGLCEQLMPRFQKAAEILKDIGVVLARVNMGKTNISKRYKINGFPTVWWFDHGQETQLMGEKTTDFMVNYAYEQLHSPPRKLDNEEDIQRFMKEKEVGFVYVSDKTKDRNYSRYLDTAFSYNYNNFAHIVNAKLASKQSPPLFAFGKQGEQKIFFNGELKLQRMKNFLENWTLGRFSSKKKDVLTRVFDYERVGVFLIQNGDDQTGIEEFKKTADLFPLEDNQLYFAVFDSNTEEIKNAIQPSNQNQIYIFSKNGSKKFKYKDSEFSSQSIQRFIQSFLVGGTQIALKSAPINDNLLTTYPSVKFINGDSFEESVLKNSQDILILFYESTDSGHTALLQVFEQVAQNLKANQNILVSALDIGQNDILNLEEKYAQTGVPRIGFYSKDSKNKPAKLAIKNNKIQVGRILIFAQENTSYKWVRSDL